LQRGKSQEEQQRLDDPSYAEKQRGQQYTAEQAQLKSTGMYQYDPVAHTVRDLQTRELNYVGNELKSAGRGAKNFHAGTEGENLPAEPRKKKTVEC